VRISRERAPAPATVAAVVFIVCEISICALCNAGNEPASNVVRHEARIVKPSTTGLRSIRIQNGNSTGIAVATKSTSQKASNAPTMLPITASTALSARACRASRQ